MSVYTIPVYPPATNNGYDFFTEQITLSGAQYVLSFVWKSRMRAWYVDIADVNGTPLVQGTRVTPGWAPWVQLQIPAMPPGIYIPVGPDPYAENDLGQSVLCAYSTDAIAAAVDPLGLRVVV